MITDAGPKCVAIIAMLSFGLFDSMIETMSMSVIWPRFDGSVLPVPLLIPGQLQSSGYTDRSANVATRTILKR